MKKLRKGFTLVELIVVIAIIAILAAVSVAGYFGFINQAKQSTADQEAAQIKNELVAMAAGNGYTVTIGNDSYTFGGNGITSVVTLGSDGYLHATTITAAVVIAKVLAKMYTLSEKPEAADWDTNIVTGVATATTAVKELVVTTANDFAAGDPIKNVKWHSGNGFTGVVFKA